MPLLSLAMIVKNESRMLPDFFRACRGIFDEIIVVDTGSTDNTIELATDFGATVYSFEWCNDFSAARNAALRWATGEWVAFFDPDERLSEEVCRSIQKLVTNGQHNHIGAAYVQMRNLLPNHQHNEVSLLRLFRNDPSIHFKHRIHEEVIDSVMRFLKDNQLKVVTIEGVVDHIGYLDEIADQQGKKQRDRQLLEALLKEEPRDLYSHFKLLELARYWNDMSLWNSATQNAFENLDFSADSDWKMFHYAHEMAVLLVQPLGLQNPRMAIQRLTALLKPLSEPSALSQYHLGFLFEQDLEVDEAERRYKSCLRLQSLREPAYSNVRPLMGLCRLAIERKDYGRAVRCVQTSFGFSLHDPELRFISQQLAQLALQLGESDWVIEMLRPVEAANALLESDRLALAQAHVIDGDAHQALTYLSLDLNSSPLGFSHLICQLCLGIDLPVPVNISQVEADRLLKNWIDIIMRSRNGLITQQFLSNATVLFSNFDWLEKELNELSRQ